MNNFFQKYNLDAEQIVEVNSLPIDPTKYIYIYYNNLENTTRLDYQYQGNYYKHKDIYINKNEKLILISRGMITRDFILLLLFLKKYREYPKLLPGILDNFDMSDEEKKIKLKRMRIMLQPIKTLEEFKNSLNLATKELPLYGELSYYGDGLMFVNKKEDLGKITDVFGHESPYAKKMFKKYNNSIWERGVVYNEKEDIYENCFVKERSNDWAIGEKFYEKEYLFEYLLNWEIQAVR